jgi:hypothetical protein
MVKKYIRNAGKPWTLTQMQQLKKLAKQNTPTPVIGLKIGRPVGGVQSKASKLGVSLKPTNQRPYNRKK